MGRTDLRGALISGVVLQPDSLGLNLRCVTWGKVPDILSLSFLVCKVGIMTLQALKEYRLIF